MGCVDRHSFHFLVARCVKYAICVECELKVEVGPFEHKVLGCKGAE